MIVVAENPEPKLHKGNMVAASYKLITLVFLVTIALVMVSVPTEAHIDVDDHAGDDTCCTHEGGSSAPATSDPVDEDCCSSCCKDCFLPCCGGQVFSRTSSEILDPTQGSTGSVTPYCNDTSLYQPKEIYHPPRF
ncbi:MAG: hypothetical protein GY746_01495 [Gammaproteobacteria bacterium]|nr:hypothetical protein [Gammaproteobacteria bacterium]